MSKSVGDVNYVKILLDDQPEYSGKMISIDSTKGSNVISPLNYYASNYSSCSTISNKLYNTFAGADYVELHESGKPNIVLYGPLSASNKFIVNTNLKSTSTYSKSIANPMSLGKWKNIGPFGNPDIHSASTGNGAIQYIKMHPTKDNIMYACSANGGLWKTVNYGRNWTPETDYFFTNNTSCIDIYIDNPNIMYLGTAEDQLIWYTEDSGKSWINRSKGIDGHVYDISINPENVSNLIVATSKGLFLSSDSGLSWVKELDGYFTHIEHTENWDMIIVSNDMDNIDPVFYYSDNRAKSFKTHKIMSNMDKVDRFYMSIYKYDNNAIEVFAYGIVNNHKPTRFIGLYKSKYHNVSSKLNSDFDFKLVKHHLYTYPNGPVPLYMDQGVLTAETSDKKGSINPYSKNILTGGFFVSPNNPDRMLTMRENLWGSDNGGAFWTKKPSYGSSTWSNNKYICTNIKSDTIFWCNDGGMWAIKENDLFPSTADVKASGLSENEYVNSKLVSKNGDICVSQANQMDVSLTNKGVFISGGNGIGQIFVRNGKATHVASVDVSRGRIKPDDDTKFITGELIVRLNGSKDKYSVYDNIEADRFNVDRLYGFTRGNISTNEKNTLLVRSPNGVDGWEMRDFKDEYLANKNGDKSIPVYDNWEIVDVSTSGIPSLTPGTFEQSRANGELAFIADEKNSTVFMCDNLSSPKPNWVQLKNAPKANIYRIATHVNNDNLIVIATDKGVFISKNKGESWMERKGIPTSKPLVVLMDKNTAEGIYILDNLTVYYIDETFTNWQEFNKGLPLQNCTDMRMAYYANGDNRLFVSKYGRGVWCSSLYSVSNKSDKPIVDFDVFNNIDKTIYVGEKIKFINLSANTDSANWQFDNANEHLELKDSYDAEVIFSKEGFYNVKLTAINEKSQSTLCKKQYIRVKKRAEDIKCDYTNDAFLPSNRGVKAIRINDDSYFVESRKMFYTDNKIFYIDKKEQLSIFINNVGYLNSLYVKAYIDFNNDGDFDDELEEISSSGKRCARSTSFFDIPDNVVVNQDLRLRIIGLDSDLPPDACIESGLFQVVDLLVNIKPDPLVFINTTSNITINSAVLSTSYSTATNVREVGFVYSADNIIDLDIYNSSSVSKEIVKKNIDKFSFSIINLDLNKKYYYRAFVRDDNGIHYSEINNLYLNKYNIVNAEALLAINNGDNSWTLKSKIFPNGNKLDEIYIQYGSGNFDTEISIDPKYLPSDKECNISRTLSISDDKEYTYRLKIIDKGMVFYSNEISFRNNKTYCIPVINNSPWYKRINSFTLNGISNTEQNDDDYHFFDKIIFSLVSDTSYPVEIIDSYNLSYKLKYLIYIDFNNDGDFDDYHEKILDENPNRNSYKGKIYIPNHNVAYGQNLRMRVIIYDGDYADPCVLSSDGQIEDYLVVLSAKPESPIVESLSVENIKHNSALSTINLLQIGVPESTSIGVCWSEYENPDVDKSISEINSRINEGISSLIINKLKPNTKYFLRSFAKTKNKVFYGKQIVFKTIKGAAISFSDYEMFINTNDLKKSIIGIKLLDKPSGDVIINIVNNNPNVISTNITQLIFDDTNWDAVQNVNVKLENTIVENAKDSYLINFIVDKRTTDKHYLMLSNTQVKVNIDGLTGINDLISGNVYVFPNPAIDKIYISGTKISKITICNMSGSKIIEKENSSTINVSSLIRGVYLIYIVSIDGIAYVETFVKY